LLSARQITAQALCISPELAVRHREAASTPVYFAMTGADAPGGGVEVGFTWSFRAGPRADRGTGAKWVQTSARLTRHRASASTGP
jgi:hypothetical protein